MISYNRIQTVLSICVLFRQILKEKKNMLTKPIYNLRLNYKSSSRKITPRKRVHG